MSCNATRHCNQEIALPKIYHHQLSFNPLHEYDHHLESLGCFPYSYYAAFAVNMKFVTLLLFKRKL